MNLPHQSLLWIKEASKLVSKSDLTLSCIINRHMRRQNREWKRCWNFTNSESAAKL